MPIPQTPSLISLLGLQTHSAPPVQDWLKRMKSKEEEIELLLAVQGIPLAWLEWTEKRVQAIETRGVKIHSRVGYSLKVLGHGITLLQECKFLCDAMENGLRAAFCSWINHHKLTVGQVYPAKFLEGLRLRGKQFPVDPHQVVAPEFLSRFDFWPLVKTISLHWEYVPAVDEGSLRTDGFRTVFDVKSRCRDRTLFTSDMDFIRNIRNNVAHSSRLFSPEETHQLYKRVSRWLSPLNVDLMGKVRAYRVNRPRFLDDLDGLHDRE